MIPLTQTHAPTKREEITITIFLTILVSTPKLCAVSSPRDIISSALENKHKIHIPRIEKRNRN